MGPSMTYGISRSISDRGTLRVALGCLSGERPAPPHPPPSSLLIAVAVETELLSKDKTLARSQNC